MARSFVPVMVASWVGAVLEQAAADGPTAASTVDAAPPQSRTPGLRVAREINSTVEEEERRLKPWEDTAKIAVACNIGNTKISCGEGTCDALGMCVCKDNWYTTDASQPCKIEKKSRTTGILLHLFLGNFGAGSFYLGWTGLGVVVLVLCLVSCLCNCVQVAMGAKKKGEGGQDAACGGLPLWLWQQLVRVLLGCVSCATCVLWIVTIVFMANGSARDGDNVPLK